VAIPRHGDQTVLSDDHGLQLNDVLEDHLAPTGDFNTPAHFRRIHQRLNIVVEIQIEKVLKDKFVQLRSGRIK
jgi:hypothetical protein